MYKVVNEEEQQRCTNCKCWRVLEDFIGVKNIPVKRCSKCREKDAKQKKKPDVIEKKNERQRKKQYYKTYREKKRADDEAVYLAHNAELMKKWREKNNEHVKAWRRKNANLMLNAMRRSAVKKDFEWTLDKDYALKMMISPCIYCGILPEDRVNGIDRMDSSLGYMPDNCVPCCKTCNYMKLRLDPLTFIERCRHIAGIESQTDAWPDVRNAGSSYVSYRRRAISKDISFEITEDDFQLMVIRACAYCGIGENAIKGVDRMDNALGYTLENCAPSCSECNYMKKTMSPVEFFLACKEVATHAVKTTFDTVSRHKKCIRSQVHAF